MAMETKDVERRFSSSCEFQRSLTWLLDTCCVFVQQCLLVVFYYCCYFFHFQFGFVPKILLWVLKTKEFKWYVGCF